MAYVVGEGCIGCKHTTCVEACPVDAFREGPNFLVIDPDECIDCDLVYLNVQKKLSFMKRKYQIIKYLSLI